MSAIKYDTNKPPIHLVEPEFILMLSQVLGYGAAKYGDDNWKDGMQITRLYSAEMRHMLAYRAGEKLDSESKLPHLLHAAANLMMMHWYDGEVDKSKAE